MKLMLIHLAVYPILYTSQLLINISLKNPTQKYIQ